MGKELLSQIYQIFSTKLSGKELIDKFQSSALNLIQTGDLSDEDYILFCEENDIIPLEIPKRKRKEKNISDGCGATDYRGC